MTCHCEHAERCHLRCLTFHEAFDGSRVVWFLVRPGIPVESVSTYSAGIPMGTRVGSYRPSPLPNERDSPPVTVPLPDEPYDDPRHGMPVVPNDEWAFKPRPRRCYFGLAHRDEPYPGTPTYVRCSRCRAVSPRGVADVVTGRAIL